jgi:hypothetical protein
MPCPNANRSTTDLLYIVMFILKAKKNTVVFYTNTNGDVLLRENLPSFASVRESYDLGL